MTYSDDIRKILEITDPNITFIEGCLDQDSITLNGVLYQTQYLPRFLMTQWLAPAVIKKILITLF